MQMNQSGERVTIFVCELVENTMKSDLFKYRDEMKNLVGLYLQLYF